MIFLILTISGRWERGFARAPLKCAPMYFLHRIDTFMFLINPLAPKPDEQNSGFFELSKMKILQIIIAFDLDKILSPEKVQSEC